MSQKKKIGILGGGQLGRMLALAAADWDIDLRFMDKSKDFPVHGHTAHYTLGDFTEYNDVFNFGKDLDVLSIEIEHVNTDALRACRDLGVLVHPDPDILDIIKDKWTQCLFYKKHGIQIPFSKLYATKQEIIQAIDQKVLSYPFVQKSRAFGYDGKGVVIINSAGQQEFIMDTPSMVQEMIQIKSEIAVIVARDSQGLMTHYDPVEMIFDPEANLLDMLICPARIDQSITQQAIEISTLITQKMGIIGLLAVELFLDQNDNLWVNEVAPRPHNSGHHTIENTHTSQYQQLIRILTGLSLGATKMISPAVMTNILGEPGFKGEAIVTGIPDILSQENVYLHLYGKKTTKPHRKMGHVTVLDQDINMAIHKAKQLKALIKIKA